MYELYSENHDNQTESSRTAYGIAVVKDGRYERIVKDITSDRRKAEALVRLFNQEDLDPVHLSAVIEDFLCQFEI